ncbi:hypothetical protein CVT26_001629, partial [Gymnopilus dilepis]
PAPCTDCREANQECLVPEAARACTRCKGRKKKCSFKNAAPQSDAGSSRKRSRRDTLTPAGRNTMATPSDSSAAQTRASSSHGYALRLDATPGVSRQDFNELRLEMAEVKDEMRRVKLTMEEMAKTLSNYATLLSHSIGIARNTYDALVPEDAEEGQSNRDSSDEDGDNEEEEEEEEESDDDESYEE